MGVVRKRGCRTLNNMAPTSHRQQAAALTCSVSVSDTLRSHGPLTRETSQASVDASWVSTALRAASGAPAVTQPLSLAFSWPPYSFISPRHALTSLTYTAVPPRPAVVLLVHGVTIATWPNVGALLRVRSLDTQSASECGVVGGEKHMAPLFDHPSTIHSVSSGSDPLRRWLLGILGPRADRQGQNQRQCCARGSSPILNSTILHLVPAASTSSRASVSDVARVYEEDKLDATQPLA